MPYIWTRGHIQDATPRTCSFKYGVAWVYAAHIVIFAPQHDVIWLLEQATSLQQFLMTTKKGQRMYVDLGCDPRSAAQAACRYAALVIGLAFKWPEPPPPPGLGEEGPEESAVPPTHLKSLVPPDADSVPLPTRLSERFFPFRSRVLPGPRSAAGVDVGMDESASIPGTSFDAVARLWMYVCTQ